MRLWRVFPWDAEAHPKDRGHPLWIPRALQGAGRHDGIRWWSSLEAAGMHVTVFDRALPRVEPVGAPEPLRAVHAAVREAADAIGVSVR